MNAEEGLLCRRVMLTPGAPRQHDEPGNAQKGDKMTTAPDTLTQHFTVSGTPKIAINNPAGVVHVVPGEVHQVSFWAKKEVRCFSPIEAQQVLEEMTVAATQTGDTITITVRLGDHPFTYDQRTVHLLVSVPPTAMLSVDLSAGCLVVDDLAGVVEARVAAGEVQLHRVTLAEQSRLYVNAGNLELDGALAPGASLDAQVYTGNMVLWLPAMTAARLEATATVGDVQVFGWPVVAKRHLIGATATGDLSAEPAGVLAVKVKVGSIQVAAY